VHRVPWRHLAIITAVCVLFFTAVIAVAVRSLSSDLPDLAALEQIRPKLTSRMYSADGEVLKTYSIQKRTLVPYEELPPHLVEVLLASEDRGFWDHWGVSPVSLVRAVLVSVSTLTPPRATSTITQQLARDLFLTKERSLVRKAKEGILAVRIERTYTKKEILQLYLNQVYFGAGSYGVQAAALSYFGVDAKDLTIEQAATLIGMLPAPNNYSPVRHPERAIARRNVVLSAMGVTGALNRHQVDSLRVLPLRTNPAQEELGIAPYFTEYIRITLGDMLAGNDSLRARFTQALGLPDSTSADELIYEGGLGIETTLDSRLQNIAERVLHDQVDTLQAYFDHGVLAPTGKIPEWVNSSVVRGWIDSSRTTSDTTVAKRIQAALVALDTRTGAVLAMIGGRDFDVTKFNRAVQALRQPGSAFKPFVYTAAIDNGYTPVSQFLNQPITLVEMIDSTWHEWRPENYDRTVGGPTTLREGLRGSINLVAIRLLREIGPSLAIQYAHNMGITTRLPAVNSLALGVGEVKLIELTAAYGTFPNNGIYVSPYAISRITARDGALLIPKQLSGERKEALSPPTAFIMTKLLEYAVDRGTGGSARWKWGFDRPAGGKTGTTNDYGDAWFVGFTPQITCGVWVGFDHRVDMGRLNTGAGAALPIWARFMKEAHTTLNLPVDDFTMPDGVVELEVCEDTYLVATPYCPNRYTDYFRKEHVPPVCNVHRVDGSAPRGPAQAGSPARRSF